MPKFSNKILKRQARKIFNQLKTIDCPAFPGEKIVFNAKGLSHFWSVIPSWRRYGRMIRNVKSDLRKQ